MPESAPNPLRRAEVSAAVQAAVVLILADLLLVALHIVQVRIRFAPHGFFLGDERGLGELYQYAKFLTLSGVWVLIYGRRRRVMYLALTLVFGYLLLDDSFAIHEQVGSYIAQRFQFTPAYGLRSIDFGEMIVSGVLGGLLLAQLVLACWTSRPVERRVGWTFVGLLILLGGCGIGFDMIHSMATKHLDKLEMLEDGGEMFVVSLMVAYAAYLYRGGMSRDEGPSRELATA